MLGIYPVRSLSREEWEAQAQLMAMLDSNGIAVTAPVSRKDGFYTHAFNTPSGSHYALLMRFVPGSAPGETLTEGQAHLYGKTVAQMHLCMDRQTGSYQRHHMNLAFLLHDPLALMAPLLEPFPVLYRSLSEMVVHIKLKLEKMNLPTTPPYYGICHGDLHWKNLLVDEQEQVTLIDWDYVSYGWRVYDLAALRRSLEPVISLEDPEKQRRLSLYEAYLRGYDQMRPLSTPEYSALPYFVATRYIWICAERIALSVDSKWGANAFTESYFDELFRTVNRWVDTYCF
ncbi:hypothetical protein KDA_49120 [Dictyobacter alpinus]|uniref:Aminoglycoside phosphotransferase domain-containing protein n=1 Tax=Dictyobacter alpinus TaxID=2014873 RepID=A0A402BDF0_9CHLR|nr:hypothetical protein KDA_49120 [Dictyobacter alpinus]